MIPEAGLQIPKDLIDLSSLSDSIRFSDSLSAQKQQTSFFYVKTSKRDAKVIISIIIANVAPKPVVTVAVFPMLLLYK